MLKLSSRSLLCRLAISCVSVSLILPATTSGAFAVEVRQSDKTAGQVFLLPPEREQTPETIELVNKNIQDGKKHLEKNEFDKAISKFQEAYGLAREIKYSDGEGMALTEMCLFYLNKGQLGRSKELGENAIEVLSNSTDKKALGQARAALARVYLLMDNTYMAMQQLQLAMNSFTNLGAADSLESSKVLILAADFGMKTGHPKEALQLYEAAAGFSGQAGKSRSQVALEIQVADELMARAYFTAALEEAQKAVSVARQSKNNDELTAALACLGNAELCLSEFANARKSYEEALKLNGLSDKAQQAMLLEGYGNALSATGDLEPARIVIEKALSVLKAEGTPARRAQLYNTLGVINTLQSNYPLAIVRLKQALEAASLMNVAHERLSITILQNLAAAQAKNGENRSAKQQLTNALQLAHTKVFKDPLLQGRTYAALSEICLNLKEYPEAEQAAKAGITVAQGANDDAALWRLYTCLAKVQLASSQPATESLTSAVSFFRSPQAGDFASPGELTYPTKREEMGEQLVSLLVQSGLVEQALLAAEQLKEETFINEWLRRGGEVRAADRDVYNDMVSRRAHLHSTEFTSMPTAVQKDWKDWLVRYQHVAEENPLMARLIAPVPINLQEVLKTIQNNHAVVIDYLVGQRSTTVFTIDSTKHLSATTLAIGKEDLQSQVAALLTASGKTDEMARSTERRALQLLYNELLPQNVSKILPSNPDQTVVVLPDAVLYNLPFAALLSPQGTFLVENHSLTMAPSLSVISENPKQFRDVSVLMAADKTGDESECHQISSIFDPAQVVTLSGKDAEISNLQEQAKSTSIIHFTSAVPIPGKDPLNSVMPLTSQEQGNKVTANSLFECNLPSDLAVLSSSSVNAKDYRGNGVQVFSRGLNYAGVRNVLMSLWVEPDPQRTSELLEFYRSRQQGLNQAQSLRKAQMLALSKDPSPRSWAAFQLLGPGF